VPEALFTPEGEHYRPSELARGPWAPGALHGGPVAALLVHLADGAEAPGAMHPARATIELLRPVPLAPLRPAVRIVRPGRKVQIVESALFAGDAEVARCTLLRLRRAAVPIPADARGGPTEPPPGPDHAAPITAPAWSSVPRAYHSHATEHRVVRGAWGESGPCTDWIRVCAPLLPDVPPSPLARVAAAADFGNGIGAALPYDRFTFLNADLTLHLHRLPVGEWVCLDAATWPEGDGVGVAESALFDERGRIGRALQSVLIEPR
jgi:hypothetical protein